MTIQYISGIKFSGDVLHPDKLKEIAQTLPDGTVSVHIKDGELKCYSRKGKA